MLSDGVDNAVDLEALQAQIDLSMALTDQLVSSWLPKSSSSKGNEKRGKNFDDELQDVLRRPARLGVGAPLPESASGTTKETQRLKYKLAGKGRKRGRDDGEQKPKDGHDSGDEEERGKGGHEESAKRVRLDPFHSGVGTRKAKRNEGDTVVSAPNGIPSSSPASQNDNAPLTTPDTIPTVASVLSPPTSKSAEGSENLPDIETGLTPLVVAMDVDSSQISIKTKKKRKKKKKEKEFYSKDSTNIDVNIEANVEVASTNDETKGNSGNLLASSSSKLPEGHPSVTVSPTGDPPAGDLGPRWTGFGSPESDDECEAPSNPISTFETKSPSRSAIDTSLLYLDGPPPMLDDVSASAGLPASPKKKRRRRKKTAISTVTQNNLTSNLD